jgi:hypothetical protein
MRGVAAIFLVLACAAPALGAAAPRSPEVSYSTWIIGERSVTLRYVLPAREAERLSGSQVPVLTVSKLGEYVLRHVAVSSDHEDCPAIDQGYDLGRVDPLHVGAGLYGFEIVFRCEAPGAALTLNDHALFDGATAHVDFARIERGGRSVQQLFTAARQRLTIALDAPTPAATAGEYARLGLRHILAADRLCLLIAALLLVRTARELGWLAAALAAGYALSLAVEATGLILPQLGALEAFVGFLIATLAASVAVRDTPGKASLALGLAWPGLLALLAIGSALAHAGEAALLLGGAALLSAGLLARVRESALPVLLCAAVFGFLDGFTLPSWLEPLRLAARTQAPMVGAYDAGALLTACAGLGLVAAGFAFVRTRWRTLPRPLVNDLAAASLGCLGTIWFLSRLHS